MQCAESSVDHGPYRPPYDAQADTLEPLANCIEGNGIVSGARTERHCRQGEARQSGSGA